MEWRLNFFWMKWEWNSKKWGWNGKQKKRKVYFSFQRAGSQRSTNQFTNSFTNQISFNLFILLFIDCFRHTRLAGSALHWGPITHPPPSKARASQLRKIKKYYNFNLFEKKWIDKEKRECIVGWARLFFGLVAMPRCGHNPPQRTIQSIPLNNTTRLAPVFLSFASLIN